MKKIIVIAFVSLISSNVYSQYKLGVGDAQLNAGVGFSSHWGTPIYVGVDYGVHKYISIGAEMSYRSYLDGFNDRQNTVSLLANGNFHFTGLLGIPKVWDIYMGFNLGGYLNNSPTTATSSTGFGLGAQFGGRYYFNKNWGINFELGGSTIFDWGKVGMSYAF